LFDRVLAIGVVAASCDATGATEQALERTADYAKERTQFGKPIGSFQAVKHHCADMAIAVEASRAATRAAAEALDADPLAWATAAAITASYVGPACSRACALALLVHGGIGFTWEHDAHMFLKRTKLDEVLFGTPSWHRRRLADAVFPTLTNS
jgi:alkylation response protein AidB-like acyl-CoA dehydrogenase